MSYPKQTKKCSSCEGYKRVAIITEGGLLFEDGLRKPLPMTYAKARKMLTEYRGTDAGVLSMMVNDLAHHLDTVACPWCNATGIEYTVQQLTDEEAAIERAKEAEADDAPSSS